MRLPLSVLFYVLGAALCPLSGAAQGHSPVMVAPEDVWETVHEVSVVFRDGLATATVDMAFARSESGLSQVLYRLPVPEGAELSAFRVCNDHGCRRGLPDSGVGDAYDLSVYAPASSGGLPIGTVSQTGLTVDLRVAPLGPRESVRVQVQYLVPTELTGGVERLDLPAREPGPALRPAIVRLAASGSASLRVDGQSADVARTIELGRAVRLEASLAATTVTRSVASVRCGDADCGRIRIAAGPRAAAPVSATLLIDVSPSMLDVPPARVAAALRAIEAVLPPASTLSPVLFARHARSLGPELQPAREALGRVARVLREGGPETWLGPSTRVESALPMLVPRLRESARPVILVGDGTVSGSPETWVALRTLVASGVQITVINLADGPVAAPLAEAARRSHGMVVDLGPHLDDPAEASRRLAVIAAPIVVANVWVEAEAGRIALGPLRSGEELTWEGRAGVDGPVLDAGMRTAARGPRGAQGVQGVQGVLRAQVRGLALRLGARFSDAYVPGHTLTAVQARDLSLARKRGGVGVVLQGRSGAGLPAPDPRVRVLRISCGCGAYIVGALSREVLARRMQTVEPRVRGCFRRARRGRPDYQARVTFHLALAGREVESARVSGDLTPDLEACLLSAVEHLEIPRTQGRVLVNYPFVTQAEPRALPMSLPDDVATAVDALF
ncbi:MAG: VWA domain-containing protein [Deltaproteobacteria bacterium]|nr:VWA domain-containing protein [Deltaproteobacteria bacterium]